MMLLLLACTPIVVPNTDPPPTDSAATADSADSADPVGIEDVPGVHYEHLGVLLIDTDGQSIPDTDKIDASMQVILDHDGTLDDLDTAPRAWTGAIGIELHGSSSLSYPQASYRIETRDAEGDDLDTPLLGMDAGSDWVLHAPYSDKTLIRNALAYGLGREVASERARWEPDTRFAEVFVNDDYVGLYLVVERVKRARLGLPAVAPSAAEGDLSGGYIVKIDQHRNEGFDTALGTPVDYHYPRAGEITAEQDAWLIDWFVRFETMLAQEDFADPAHGYPAWIDRDSWIDHFLVNELAHNIDAYRLSAYLYKQADADGGRLFAGPLWDFDRAWGNVNYCDCWQPQGFIIDDLGNCDCAEQFPFWWTRLAADVDYVQARRCRWEELRQGTFSDAALTVRIDQLVLLLAEAEPRDHARWPVIGVDVDPNYYVGDTYEDEVAWLTDWTLARAAWLDQTLPGSCPETRVSPSP